MHSEYSRLSHAHDGNYPRDLHAPRAKSEAQARCHAQSHSDYEEVCCLRNAAERDLRDNGANKSDLLIRPIAEFLHSRSLYVRLVAMNAVRTLAPHAADVSEGIKALAFIQDHAKNFIIPRKDNAPSDAVRLRSSLPAEISREISKLGEIRTQQIAEQDRAAQEAAAQHVVAKESALSKATDARISYGAMIHNRPSPDWSKFAGASI